MRHGVGGVAARVLLLVLVLLSPAGALAGRSKVTLKAGRRFRCLVDMAQCTLEKELGEGAFGSTWRVRVKVDEAAALAAAARGVGSA
eukprot:CAMPEP_0118967990 /NCGR_PEP_ID=MMETSP1173-20130426/5294_1 /TAXON_ID=1034831 /ORGANISM="Rhizochromulina marina cf, Strain CCMP1243" /LENGTH=86 /DNA_ID=CAMNT_0006917039 /DNA_START=36 /DNA_END=292 /DNA_ORIENTATION=+